MMETDRFDTNLFRYELKQWNCTAISITSSIVSALTRKKRGEYFSFFKPSTPRLNQHESKRLNIKTTGVQDWIERSTNLKVFVIRGELNTEPCSFAARVCHILSSFIFLIDAIHGSHGPVR